MTLIIETGQGLPDAESYASAADLVMYAGKFGVVIPADAPAQEALLRRAALAMDGMTWKGCKTNSEQALSWPRREVLLDHEIKPNNYLPARIQYGPYFHGALTPTASPAPIFLAVTLPSELTSRCSRPPPSL
jgi:hypothetical protein